jgi:hypothetical protein
MVWVREQTIPTERQPLCQRSDCQLFADRGVPRGQRDGSLRPYSVFSRHEPLLFNQIAPQLFSRGWVDPVPDPLHFSGSAGNRNRAFGSVAKNSDTCNKAVSVLNWLNTTPWRYMGQWRYNSIIDFGTSWRWVVSSTTRPLYHGRKSLRYPLDRRLSGAQNRPVWRG